MKILCFIIRVLLFMQFFYAGIEKLFLPFDATKLREENALSGTFVQFYTLLHDTGYLLFVGFFQALCAVLLLFRKTYLLGAVMLTPILFCLVATHVFITRSNSRAFYDLFLMTLNTVLILCNYQSLKQTFFPLRNQNKKEI